MIPPEWFASTHKTLEELGMKRDEYDIRPRYRHNQLYARIVFLQHAHQRAAQIAPALAARHYCIHIFYHGVEVGAPIRAITAHKCIKSNIVEH